MIGRTLLIFWVCAAFAADDPQFSVALTAQIAFDRVALQAAPPLRDTGACILTQASHLSVATPRELPIVHYRKGYCTLAEAVIKRSPMTFQQAVSEFDAAIESWPRRLTNRGKLPPEPLSSGVRV